MPLTLPTATFDPLKTIFGSKVIAQISAGAAGVKQVETATVVATVSGAGNATFTVTAAGVSGSPLAVSVPVLVGDNAIAVAQKARIALAATGAITSLYAVTLALDATVQLVSLLPQANDPTLNIAIATGTATGITAAPTSVDTTAGVAAGALFNVVAKVGDLAVKQTTKERKVPGTDNVNRNDRQAIVDSEEFVDLVDLEEIDNILTNFGGFTPVNKTGTCTLYVCDQNDPTGTSVRLKSNAFKCSVTVKSGTTKLGGGDFSKASLHILSIDPAGITFTPNATS